MVLTDGSAVAPLEPSQDYKRALDGDGGPNTGGMGAFSTPGLVHPDMAQRILESVIHPAIAGMAGEGCPFQGILYAGLMITGAGPRVLEFNVRLGDPETEVVLPRLESDLAMLLRAAAGGRLPAEPIRWSRRSAACVVLASGGYPGAYATGARISGLDGAALPEGVTVFHAGTRCADGALVTAGGRVLAVTATGGSVCEAAQTAYQAVEQIHFEGMHYRRDIGAEYRKQS